jgi:hypothetical protein
LLCSLRSTLVKNSAAPDLGMIQTDDPAEFPSRKITTSRHLERAIKSLSINTDISRKF